MPMPLLICGCCTAPVLGCHQSDTWAWWEEGAALVPSAVDFTSGPPHLPLGTAGTSAARGSCRVARGRQEPASCILHPGEPAVSLAVPQSLTSPSPQRDFGMTTCILVHTLAKALSKCPHCVCKALTGFQNPPPARLPGKLPGPPEQPWGMGYSCWSRSLDLAAALLWKEL